MGSQRKQYPAKAKAPEDCPEKDIAVDSFPDIGVVLISTPTGAFWNLMGCSVDFFLLQEFIQ
jgi:hypothetical protein